MLGMLSLGFIADKIGRKWGSVCCASFMFMGGILLTASSGPTLAGWATMFTISQVRCRNKCCALRRVVPDRNMMVLVCRGVLQFFSRQLMKYGISYAQVKPQSLQHLV